MNATSPATATSPTPDALAAILSGVASMPPSAVTTSVLPAGDGADDAVTLAGDRNKADPLGAWKKILADADEAFARQYKALEALVKATESAFPSIIREALKTLVEALEKDGKTTKVEVAFVARDPKQPIIYFYTRDGRIIGYSPVSARIGLPSAFGFSLNFLTGLGYFPLKQTVTLVLPNGDCLILPAN